MKFRKIKIHVGHRVGNTTSIVQFILKSLGFFAPVSLFLNVALPSFERKHNVICLNRSEKISTIRLLEI